MVAETERSLVRPERPGQIATSSPTGLIDSFGILDVYAGGISEEAPRVEALATISAGFRGPSRGDRPGLPQRSTDGTIILHDGTNRAPGLKLALERAGMKTLTIAFPFDDPARFIHCRFMSYSATELLAYGDETHMMVLVPQKGYQRFKVGSEEYVRAVNASKVSVSVYFCLAEWGADGPEIVFPDGVGAYYRLRFTSRHSLRSILAGLRSIGQFTQGRIAGIPFDLSIDYREVAGTDGKKRRIPVWALASKPPNGLRLTSRNFGEVMGMALEQGAALILPAPPEPTFEDALAMPPDDDLDDSVIEGVVVGEPSDRDIDLISRGGRCNEKHWRNMFFSAVGGSELDGDESPGRAAWLLEYTQQRTNSLSDFLDDSVIEGVVVGEPSDRDIDLISRGGRCNEKHWRNMFFSAVGGSELDGDESPGRAAWLLEYTQQRTNSLSDFLHWATEREAQAMVVSAADELNRRRIERNARGEAPPARTPAKPKRTFEDLFPDDDRPAPVPAQPVAPAESSAATNAAPLVLPDEPDWLHSDDRPLMCASWNAWEAVTRRLDAAYEIPDPSKLSNPRLVKALRDMVGYASQTHDSIYGGDPEPEDEQLVDADEIAEEATPDDLIEGPGEPAF